jgi:hypothetical protein
MNDLLIDMEGNADVLTVGGDFATGESDEQCVQMLLVSTPGQWKEHPEAGVGLNMAQNGAVDRFMERNIRVQMKADGFDINTLTITEAGINIDGSYERV